MCQCGGMTIHLLVRAGPGEGGEGGARYKVGGIGGVKVDGVDGPQSRRARALPAVFGGVRVCTVEILSFLVFSRPV